MESRSSKVVIVGGGVAALEAALALHELASELVEVELVAPERSFAYRPMLVAEPFGAGEVRTFPLSRLAEAAGASVNEAVVTGVDPDRHVVRTAAGDELPFDLLLLAPGAVPVVAVPGAICFRGPRDAEALRKLLADAAAGIIDRVTFAVPSGASWPLPLYELALLTRSYLVDEGAVDVTVGIVTPEDSPLALFSHAASDAVAELLEARGIELLLSTSPLAFADGGLSTAPWRCRASKGRAWPASCMTRPASSRPTTTARSAARSMSGRPVTRRPSRSSRAGSPPSRPTRRRRRSLLVPVPTSTRIRSARSSAGCC
jgi:sulfide:quinone oxidoreductase